jgi:hypothetical protein
VGLSQEDQPVIRHNLVISALTTAAVAMTVLMTAFAVSPADARDNKKEHVARQSSSPDASAPSRARTQPDSSGISQGSPICY